MADNHETVGLITLYRVPGSSRVHVKRESMSPDLPEAVDYAYEMFTDHLYESQECPEEHEEEDDA